jgi:hypothetical protein
MLGEFSCHDNAPNLSDRNWPARIEGNERIDVQRRSPQLERRLDSKKI